MSCQDTSHDLRLHIMELNNEVAFLVLKQKVLKTYEKLGFQHSCGVAKGT